MFRHVPAASFQIQLMVEKTTQRDCSACSLHRSYVKCVTRLTPFMSWQVYRAFLPPPNSTARCVGAWSHSQWNQDITQASLLLAIFSRSLWNSMVHNEAIKSISVVVVAVVVAFIADTMLSIFQPARFLEIVKEDFYATICCVLLLVRLREWIYSANRIVQLPITILKEDFQSSVSPRRFM